MLALVGCQHVYGMKQLCGAVKQQLNQNMETDEKWW